MAENIVITDLEKLQLIELDIAKEVKRICEKNNINYFLIAGSLLGAVRHKGFIPWDDDMDLGMTRSDYNKFLAVCKTDLDTKYFLQTWDTESDYPFSFAKIRLNGTKIEEAFSEFSTINKGIFVDIFPFDNAPNDENERNKIAKKHFLLRRILWIKKGMGTNMKSDGIKQKAKYFAFKFISAFYSYNKTKNQYYNLLTQYNNTNCDFVVADGSYGYKKETLPKKYINNLTDYDFMGTTFKGIKDYDGYLTYFYGDYMTPPDEENRNVHLRQNINFGKY